MRGKALLPQLLLLLLLLSSCSLVQQRTEERLVFLSLPPASFPEAQSALVGGFSLPKGTYRVEVWAEASSTAPLWLGIISASSGNFPSNCQGESSTGYIYCSSALSPLFPIEPSGSWVDITARVIQNPGSASSFFIGIGWPSGTIWNGSVNIRLRYEAF
jgi:hypothetical protein